MKPVEFDPEAEAEVRAAVAYLNDQRPDLGYEFAAEVEAAVELIGQQPKAFSPHRDGYRKYVLTRFGYLIFYCEYDAYVWIAAVHHGRRRPGYWRHRQPGR